MVLGDISSSETGPHETDDRFPTAVLKPKPQAFLGQSKSSHQEHQAREQ